MVEVNGGMVPPIGYDKKKDPGIVYSEIGDDNQVKKDKGRKLTGKVEKGDSLAPGGTMPNPMGAPKPPPGTPGGAPRKSGNQSISIVRNDCWTLVLMHAHLQSKGCSSGQMQGTKEKFDKAAAKWDATIPCPKGTGTCHSFFVRMVWHDEPNSDVINVRVDCTSKAKKTEGETKSGADARGDTAYIEVAPADEQSEGYYAHELGHNMFGTKGSDEGAPKEWNGEPHNPDDQGLMRDTSKKKKDKEGKDVDNGIKPDEKPSSAEIKLLFKKYGVACNEKCCKKSEEKSRILIGGGIVSTGSVSTSTGLVSISTVGPASSRTDGLVYIRTNVQD